MFGISTGSEMFVKLNVFKNPDIFFCRTPIHIISSTTSRSEPVSSGGGISTSQFVPSTTESAFEDNFTLQSTIRPTEDERADTMEKLMKEEKDHLITQFYPDYDYEEEIRTINKNKNNNNNIGGRTTTPKIKVNRQLWTRLKSRQS
jgi:hypothetical protein